MLKLLDKIQNGKVDFTKKELEKLTPYIAFYMDKHNIDVVEKIFLHHFKNDGAKKIEKYLNSKNVNDNAKNHLATIIDHAIARSDYDLALLIVSARKYELLSWLAQAGKGDQFKKCLDVCAQQLKSSDFEQLLENEKFLMLRMAADGGNREIVTAILESTAKTTEAVFLEKMMAAHRWGAIGAAAESGHHEIVDDLMTFAVKYGGKKLAREMLEGDDFYPFVKAARNGRPQVIRTLINWAEKLGPSDLGVRMLKTGKCQAFKAAGMFEHPEIVEILLNKALEKGGGNLLYILLRDGLEVFEINDTMKHIIGFMEKLAVARPEVVQHILSRDKFSVFGAICKNTKGEALTRFLELAQNLGGQRFVQHALGIDANKQSLVNPETVQAVIRNGDPQTFHKLLRIAVAYDQPEATQRTDAFVKNIFGKSGATFFSETAQAGSADMMLELALQAYHVGGRDLFREMISKDNFEVFHTLCENAPSKAVLLLGFIREQGDSSLCREMWASRDYGIFKHLREKATASRLQQGLEQFSIDHTPITEDVTCSLKMSPE